MTAEPAAELPEPARTLSEIRRLTRQVKDRMLACPEVAAQAEANGVSELALEKWARTEAMASMIWEYIMSLDSVDLLAPRSPGGYSPAEIWMILERRAASCRERLGIDFDDYPGIAKRLGLSTGDLPPEVPGCASPS